MTQEEVKIFFKVEGLDGYITDLDELQDALKGVAKDTEEVAENTSEIGKSGGKAKSFFSAVKGKGVGAFKALKGAIAATGIGLLLTGLAQLVSWFKESDTGAKILQGTTAALGAIFGQLQTIFFDLVDLIKPLFEDPVESLKAFGQAIVDNLINRFTGILELIPNLARAVGELFKGNFAEAGTIAANAVGKVVLGVEDTVAVVTQAVEVVQDFGEKAVKVFNETVVAVVAAVEASNSLIDAQNELRKLQQDLLVQNAQLNQELETQKKVSEDTTRAYDERKAALDRVNAANEKLADNAVLLAQQERDTLALQLQLASTDEERREIKDGLAEANAALIESETAAQIVRLESAQLNRELDEEEANRKQDLLDTEIATTKERNDAIIAADEALAQAKFAAAQGGVQLLSALAGENEKAQNALFAVDKALAVAQVIVNAAKAKGANIAYAASLGPAGPAYLASANTAVNLNTGIQLASIAAATIAKYKNSSGDVAGTSGGGTAAAGSINYNLGNQQAGGTVTGPGTVGGGGTGGATQTYVLAGNVTSQQEAEAQIINLARL